MSHAPLACALALRASRLYSPYGWDRKLAGLVASPPAASSKPVIVGLEPQPRTDGFRSREVVYDADVALTVRTGLEAVDGELPDEVVSVR
jgi:hypothetical protein